MNDASARIWTFATIIGVIAIVALGWFLGIAPKLADIARIESERTVVAAQNDINRVTLQTLQADFEKLDEYRQQLDDIEAEFPELPEYADVAETFFRDLVTADLTLQNLVLQEPTAAAPETILNEFGQVPQGTLVRLNGSIGVEGEFSDIFVFIESLQRDGRFILVPTATFSEGDNPDSRGASISFSIFMIAGEPAEGAIQISETPAGPDDQAADEEAAEG